jgi:hypothetical protein
VKFIIKQFSPWSIFLPLGPNIFLNTLFSKMHEIVNKLRTEILLEKIVWNRDVSYDLGTTNLCDWLKALPLTIVALVYYQMCKRCPCRF